MNSIATLMNPFRIKKCIVWVFLIPYVFVFAQTKEEEVNTEWERLKKIPFDCSGGGGIKSYLSSPWRRHYGSFTFSKEGILYYDYGDTSIKLAKKTTPIKVNQYIYFLEEEELSKISAWVNDKLYSLEAEGIYSSLTFKIKRQHQFDSIIMGFAGGAHKKEREAIVTLNNTFYWIEGEDIGFSYHHDKKGTNWSKKQIRYHNYPPLIARLDKDKYTIITRFSSGDLIAFDHTGKKVWEINLPTASQDKAIHYLSFKYNDDDHYDHYNADTNYFELSNKETFKELIVLNQSFIFGIDFYEGKILWSIPIKSKKAHVYARDRKNIFMISLENEIMKMDIETKKIQWKKKLPLEAKEVYYNFNSDFSAIFLTTNISKMFLIDESNGEIIKEDVIPEGVYHPRMIFPPGDTDDAHFNTEKGSYSCVFDPKLLYPEIYK